MNGDQLSGRTQNSTHPFHTSIWPVIVILLGFLFRYYSFYFTPVANQDATFYINQAKAIFYGHYSEVTLCHPHVSIYPLMIAPCYKFVGDWIVSGAMVSILFSSLMLIPLYLLLRRFFDRNISTLALLVFAVCPKFVSHSHMIIRGPIYWFFATLGVYLFIRERDEMKGKYLVLSCSSFIMASFARGEALFYILCSVLFIIFSRNRRKLTRLFLFLTPVLSVLLLLCVILFFMNGTSTLRSLPLDHIFSKAKGVISGYTSLLHSLRNIDKLGPPPGFSPYFFPAVRRMIFLIAFGELFRTIMNAFFAPFFVLLLLGIPGIKEKAKNDKRLAYLCLLSAGSLLVLYAQTISNWAIITRHAFLFLLPSFVFLGFGIERLVKFLTKRLMTKQILIYPAVFMAIFLFALPSNLKITRGKDKLAFRQIGEFIAMKQGNDQRIRVGGAFGWVSLVDLYANLNFDGVSCFRNTSLPKNASRGTIKHSLESNFDYYVWSEKYDTQETLEAILPSCPQKFEKVGQWWSRKVGKMFLFRIKK